MALFSRAAVIAFCAMGTTSAAEKTAGSVRGNKKRILDGSRCVAPQIDNAILERLLYNAGGLQATRTLLDGPKTIGSITALIPEAQDAARSDATVEDGMSGDIDFPHGNLKPIATVGEYDACTGEMIVGVPDGLGAYLADDDTVRVVVQSESYGQLRYESYPFHVNDGAASFTGSHVQYVDYDREAMSHFMDSDFHQPASNFVLGMGELIEYSYNLKGELVGPRNRDGPTTYGAHYSNTDAEGNYVLQDPPTRADWLMQSLCSAHLEEKHQWGPGVGLEDRMFLTHEEWIQYKEGAEAFVGISSHALDIATKTEYAVGAFTNAGFEKSVEINPMHKDYIVLALSGYNGDFTNYDKVLERRNMNYERSDGKEYVWTENIHPARIYIGVKGYMEDGSKAPKDDFLARNGLRYGQVYGFAVDMKKNGSTKGLWRDEFHRSSEYAHNGAKVEGKFLPIAWRWDGEVRDFSEDGAWEFQDIPPGYKGTDWRFWNAKGYDEAGCKTEHISPDPRQGKSGYIQGSTCGYFGHYYLTNLKKMFEKGTDSPNMLPTYVEAEYYVYQGELSVVDQIKLGDKGRFAWNGYDAKRNYSGGNATHPGVIDTFEDIDGLEIIHADGGKIYAIIQEDSGSWFGDRMFITSPLEHDDDGQELTYYFIAMSGGKLNTRMVEGVGIPAGTNVEALSHEFSGVFDLSGLLRKKGGGSFALSTDDPGHKKRAEDAKVDINDKDIVMTLQAPNMRGGLIDFFQADRGGQWLVYRPNI